MQAQVDADTLPVQGGVTTLQECLARGLEHNFSIKMVKNQQEVSANNATPANAGLLPTVDVSASYSGDFSTTRTTPRATGNTTTERGAYDGTLDAGIDLNWTVFDGFSVWTNYKQLKLLKEQYLHHKAMGNNQISKAWQGAMQLLYDMPTLTPPNEWVSVEDTVPDPGERVLATDGIFVGEAYRTSADSWYRHTGFPWRDGVTGRTVKYWMSLPAPPDRRPPEGESNA